MGEPAEGGKALLREEFSFQSEELGLLFCLHGWCVLMVDRFLGLEYCDEKPMCRRLSFVGGRYPYAR